MTTGPEKQTLSAILKADVQSYSRLMGEDEQRTVKTLLVHRQTFAEHVEKNGGHVVSTPGDSILALLPSVVGAVLCAVDIQDQLNAVNADLPDNRKMNFCIGIHLDDVIHRDGDIYGDGVNIAARVEALAPGGGICVTQSVFERVKKKLSHLTFNDLGAHRVKNIEEPIGVYRVAIDRLEAFEPVDTMKQASNKSHKVGTSSSICIAVLPFENFSGKKETDYFSRGFVEDLITDLSHFSNLQVISSYTSTKIDAALNQGMAVAEELGIDYLLKGNLRRLGEQIRISTQLIDRTGGVFWAERYDAPLDSIFEIQDDIIERVAGALSSRIDKALLIAARKKPLTSLAAYDCWLQGMEYLRQGTPADDQKARQTFNQALTIDPHYSRAYAGLSLSFFNEWGCQVWSQWDEIEQQAYKYAQKANQLDDTDHVIQMVLGRILMYRSRLGRAEQHLDRSLALNANDADTLVQISTCKTLLGKSKEALALYRKALRLNPYRKYRYHIYGAFAHFAIGQYDQCIDLALKGPLTDVWIDQPGIMAAAYAYLGDRKQARHYLDIFIDVFQRKFTAGKPPDPEEIVDWVTKANPFKNKAEMDHLVKGYYLAGLDHPKTSASNGPAREEYSIKASLPNRFHQLDNKMWQMAYDGDEIELPEVKGFHDLAKLLTGSGTEIHCTELMGSQVRIDNQDTVIDEKARQAYEQHLRDLKADIEQAKANNDLSRVEKLKLEYDELIDHLSKALGLGKRTRSFNNVPVERARAAVTSRIRSAIRKIDTVHPTLGKHLTNAIRTGVFCSYTPEKDQNWLS